MDVGAEMEGGGGGGGEISQLEVDASEEPESTRRMCQKCFWKRSLNKV